MTPTVEVLREGSKAAFIFDSLLIDDPDGWQPPPGQLGDGASSSGGTDGSGDGAAAGVAPGPSPTGLAAFLEHVKAEMVAALQEEALNG